MVKTISGYHFKILYEGCQNFHKIWKTYLEWYTSTWGMELASLCKIIYLKHFSASNQLYSFNIKHKIILFCNSRPAFEEHLLFGSLEIEEELERIPNSHCPTHSSSWMGSHLCSCLTHVAVYTVYYIEYVDKYCYCIFCYGLYIEADTKWLPFLWHFHSVFRLTKDIHSIARPHAQAIECLLWRFWRKSIILYNETKSTPKGDKYDKCMRGNYYLACYCIEHLYS